MDPGGARNRLRPLRSACSKVQALCRQCCPGLPGPSIRVRRAERFGARNETHESFVLNETLILNVFLVPRSVWLTEERGARTEARRGARARSPDSGRALSGLGSLRVAAGTASTTPFRHAGSGRAGQHAAAAGRCRGRRQQDLRSGTACPARCPACGEAGSDSDPPAYDHKQAGAAPGLVHRRHGQSGGFQAAARMRQAAAKGNFGSRTVGHPATNGPMIADTWSARRAARGDAARRRLGMHQ